MTIEEAKKKGLIGYTYLRGSHSQNLNGPDSDEDFGGVYFAPIETILGLGNDYQEEISDEKHDETYHEFGKWMTLISKGNPNALESLFVPEQMVVGEAHPVIQKVLNNRDKFISKEVVKALSGYAFNQIKKARGLGKKIVNPVTERKDVLDFCFVDYGQGSKPIKEFLKEKGLDQRYCGLVNIPNMPHTYGVYYDFAAYFKFEGIDSALDRYNCVKDFYSADTDMILADVKRRILEKEFYGYGGIVQPDEIDRSNTVRLSSIPKGEKPICKMYYNKDAYTCHCREYKEYQEWVEKRNQKRYSKAVEAGYNQKNMCHCIRLLTMAKEISEGKGFNLWRTDDRDFLMGIKNGDYTYEYLIDYAEKLLADVEKNLPNSCLPDQVDKDFVNDLLVKCRKEYYGINC
jgi:predicted nucleotidyltransferase